MMGGQPPHVGQPWWMVVGKITFYLDIIDNRYMALVMFGVCSVLVYLVWFYMFGS